MSRLAWMAFQISIIGLLLWLDYEVSVQTGDPPHPGIAFGMGCAAAGMATWALSRGWDLIFRRRAASKEGSHDTSARQRHAPLSKSVGERLDNRIPFRPSRDG